MTKKPYAERIRMSRRFRRLRRLMKVTQLEMAALLQMDRSELIHIEKGRRYPQYRIMANFRELERNVETGRDLAQAARQK